MHKGTFSRQPQGSITQHYMPVNKSSNTYTLFSGGQASVYQKKEEMHNDEARLPLLTLQVRCDTGYPIIVEVKSTQALERRETLELDDLVIREIDRVELVLRDRWIKRVSGCASTRV